MKWINRDDLQNRILAGSFLNLGSPAAVEIAAETGFDWLLIDLEHGSGSLADLRNMLLACAHTEASPIVRIRSVDADTVKFVMDSGAAGIMFPFVSDVEEAKLAVKYSKYPPMGTRGVAGAIRATNYGRNWKSYFAEANEKGSVIVQIETAEAVAAAPEIAAVEGVDVLFVGPLDLSVNLGCPGDFTGAEFTDALQAVVDACESQQKTAGILTKTGFEQQHLNMGFRFVAVGSDSLSVADGMQRNLRKLRPES